MYETFTLSNGLRVIAEQLPHLRSVAVGLWVGAGSMQETPAENGLSHFLEHMLFKGTETRTAKEIAEAFDGIGGQLNAFTGKECTCYYGKVMDEHLPIAMDVLTDLLLNATIDDAELEKERGVILEEIAMVEDTPDDIVFDLLSEAAYEGTVLAQTILGPSERIAAYQRADLLAYRGTHYRPDNTVLAVAGRFDLQMLRDLAEKHLGSWPAQAVPAAIDTTARFTAGIRRKDKDVEQVHLSMAFPGVALGHDDTYPLAVFNNLFGGGMSSRLFQRIREDSGMAYSVYSFPSSLPGSGQYTLYAGTSPQHAEAVARMLREETERVLRDGVPEAEFRMAREQLKGGYILGQESASSRMSGIGRGTLLMDRARSEDEVIERIKAVTLDGMMALATRILTTPNAAAVVGRDAGALPEDMLLWRNNG